MTRLAPCVALAVLVTGCSATRAALPGWAPDVLKATSVVSPSPPSERRTGPALPPPATVHVLGLAEPGGAVGRLELTRTVRSVPEEPAKDKRDAARGGDTTVTSFQGAGGIKVKDDLGEWTFGYTPVEARDAAGKTVTLQALAVRFRSALTNALTFDWAESTVSDPSGATQPIAHRDDSPDGTPRPPTAVPPGGTVDDWVLPAEGAATGKKPSPRRPRVLFELLAPSGQVRLALVVHRGDQRLVKTFVFEPRPAEAAAPGARPIGRWVGETFAVVPRPPSRWNEPYQALEVLDKIRHPATPEEFAGATLKVVAVHYDRLDPIVVLVREGTGQHVLGRVTAGSVEGIAPAADIRRAREEWLGQTLWLAQADLQIAGASGADVLPVKRLAPVEVVDVALGWSTAAPIRFTLKTADGRVGFRDVHTTGTNVPEPERESHAFARALLTEDPRLAFDWPSDVWAAIEDGRVIVGMTAAQARMSWGAPRRVERIAGTAQEERWTYADRRALAFVDGVVTAVTP